MQQSKPPGERSAERQTLCGKVIKVLTNAVTSEGSGDDICRGAMKSFR